MEFRVYYEDTDAGGVVYNARYLGFFERGRTEFLRERGVTAREMADNGSIFPVIRVEMDFRAPAVLDDLLRVETRVLEVGKAAFTLEQKVLRAADGKVLVEGKVTLACISQTLKAKRLPSELVEILNAARI